MICSEALIPGGAPQRARGVFKEMDAAERAEVSYTIMGRDAFSEESNGLSVAQQLAPQGSGITLVPCPARLEDAVARMNDLFLMPPLVKGEEEPAEDAGWPELVIVKDRCPELVKQLRTVMLSQIGGKTQGTKDLMDCLRMLVMAQERAHAVRPRAYRPERSFDDPDEFRGPYNRYGEPIEGRV